MCNFEAFTFLFLQSKPIHLQHHRRQQPPNERYCAAVVAQHPVSAFHWLVLYQLIIYLPKDIFFWSVAIFYAISIGIFHIMRYYHKKILSLKNTNFLTLSLIIWMTIILIGDYAVLQSIKNGLEPLDPGGVASVITNPGSGSFNSHLNLSHF